MGGSDHRNHTVLPSLKGLTTAQAGAALNSVGLRFGSVTYAVDLTCTNVGLITAQSPAAGTRVTIGSAVSVRIGSPPRPPLECP